MAWFLRQSPHGVHMVYGQQAENSCGIACVMMVNFKLKKGQLVSAISTLPVGVASAPIVMGNWSSAVKIEQEVYAAYAKASGSPYDGSSYTDAILLPKILNKLGIGTWAAEYQAPDRVADRLIQLVGSPTGAPVIALLHWRSGGGHFVVCDTVVAGPGNVTYGDICDPWDSSVRTVPLQSGAPVAYAPTKAGGLVNLGQSHKDYDASGDAGVIDGWIIRRVHS